MLLVCGHIRQGAARFIVPLENCSGCNLFSGNGIRSGSVTRLKRESGFHRHVSERSVGHSRRFVAIGIILVFLRRLTARKNGSS